MKKSTIRASACWAWVPLLAINLALLGMLRSLSHETQVLRAETEAAARHAAALMAELSHQKDAPAGTAAAGALGSSNPVAKKQPQGAQKGFSDWDVMSDPELGPPVLRRHRRYAMGNYRKAIESMHLPPAEEDKLKKLVAARWNAAVDAHEIVRQTGDDAGEIRQKAIAAADAEGNNAIRAFVGEDAYGTFETERDVSVNRTTSWMLFTSLWDAGIPLAPAQEDAYARALQQVNSQFQDPASRGTPDSETGLNRADLALLQAVGSFLSPDQVALIRSERMQDAQFYALERMKSSLGKGH